MEDDDTEADRSFDALLREVAAVPVRPVRAPGTVLAGRYRLDRLLGEGGMGIVWAATHTVTQSRIALKLMTRAAARRPSARRRFVREARAASAVDHPNVVPIRDVFELEDGELVMVMDLIDGETLRALLERSAPLTLEQTASLLLPAVAAVGTAHAHGIVHRDLKPENLLLAGHPPSAHVLDFGLAKLLPDARVSTNSQALTEDGQTIGTPAYMAPEQALGEVDVDRRADVWSLGAIVYECLTGRRFIDEETFGRVVQRLTSSIPTPSASAPELPSDVTDVLNRMLVADRGERLEDLQPLYDVLSRHAPREQLLFDPSPNALPSPPHRRRRGAVVLLGFAAVAFGAAALWLAQGTAERAKDASAGVSVAGASGFSAVTLPTPSIGPPRPPLRAEPASPPAAPSVVAEQPRAHLPAPSSPALPTPAQRREQRAAPRPAPSPRATTKAGLIESAPF